MSRKLAPYFHASNNYVWSTSSILGKGAGGIVYRGVNKETGEHVAVKTFPGSNYRQYNGQIREMEVFSKLSHENIVKLLAIEEDENQSKVLVMELCTGGSLGNILDDPRNQYGFDEEEFLTLLKDLSSGMKYLRRDKDITHRDMKPANIMKLITEDGRSVYKLSDFGAARELKDDQPFISLHGTEEYLHPDLYKAAVLRVPIIKSFKVTTDLWSIGVTLYHIATGSLPFRPYGGRNNKETMFKIITNKTTGVISGIQQAEGGPIEWSSKLPQTCCLSMGLQKLVTPLLAKLCEYNSEFNWSFDEFFETATDIVTRRVIHCVHLNESNEIHLYLQPSNISGAMIKNELYELAEVPPDNQWLIYNGKELSSGPYPDLVTTPDSPIYLVSKNHSNCRGSVDIPAQFPILSTSTFNVDHDAAIAKSCCTVAHVIANRVKRHARLFHQLCHAPKILANFIKDKTDRLKDLLKRLKESAHHQEHCLKLFESPQKTFLKLLGFQSEELVTMKQVLQDKKQSSVAVIQQLTTVEMCLALLSTSVADLLSKWNIPEGDRWNEKARTYVVKIRESWQVLQTHKIAKKLTYHDEQFHSYEKLKIQRLSQKLLDLHKNQLHLCKELTESINIWLKEFQDSLRQCRAVEEDLRSTEVMVKAFHDTLQETEDEVEKVYSQLATSHIQFTASPPSFPTQPTPPTLNSNTRSSSSSDTNSSLKLQKLREVLEIQKQTMDICKETSLVCSKYGRIFDDLEAPKKPTYF